jgi:hypothetical protein
MHITPNMKKALFGILGIVSGFLVGFQAGGKTMGKAMLEIINEMGVGDPIITIGALEALRNGDDNKAISILEGKLDSEIILLKDKTIERESTRKLMLTNIERARSYRTKYPYKSGLYSTDRDVEFVLKLNKP